MIELIKGNGILILPISSPTFMCICFSILAVQFEIAPWTRADDACPAALEPEL